MYAHARENIPSEALGGKPQGVVLHLDSKNRKRAIHSSERQQQVHAFVVGQLGEHGDGTLEQSPEVLLGGDGTLAIDGNESGEAKGCTRELLGQDDTVCGVRLASAVLLLGAAARSGGGALGLRVRRDREARETRQEIVKSHGGQC